jgi:biotin transport system substrate-specific component
MNIKRLTLISLFTALIVVATNVIPPIYIFSIPVTLQTLMVMITGIMLTPKDAFIAVFLYLVIGAIGLPIFSGFSGGIAIFAGPTGGFLIAFPLSAFLISLLKGNKPFWRLVSVNIIFGSLLVYIIGGISISLVNKINYFNSLQSLLIFIPIDISKAIIAAFVGTKLKHVSY